jgi:hypothetical protein
MFNVFFALWGEVGPNWHCELVNWSYEEESKWFSPKSPRKSYARVVKQPPKSVFKWISYPSDYCQKNFALSHPHVSLEKKFHGTSPASPVQRVLRESPGSLRNLHVAQHRINIDSRSLLRCFRCLASDHRISECHSMVRCRSIKPSTSSKETLPTASTSA